MQPETVVKYEGVELPPLKPEQTRLVVAANGTFRERHTAMFSTSTRLDAIDVPLGDHYQYCALNCGKINRVMHRAMLSFFRYAYALHGGEAALVLLYDPDRRRFRWHCPTQSVEMYWSWGRWVTSDYIAFQNPTVLPPGYVHFGDAHLHVGKVTTPSVTDLRDDQDGLHIIVGNIEEEPRYHIDFVIDGKRFGVQPELIFEDPGCQPSPQPPSHWLNRLKVEKYVPYQAYDAQSVQTWDNPADDQWRSRDNRLDHRNWSADGNGSYRERGYREGGYDA